MTKSTAISMIAPGGAETLNILVLLDPLLIQNEAKESFGGLA